MSCPVATLLTQPDPTWQYQWVTSRPRPADPQRPIFGGPTVGAGAVAEAFNSVAIPTATRVRRLRSEDHVSTEVYGTAPYLGRGDGIMLHVETSNRLRDGIPVLRGDKGRYSEYPISRWHFVDQPLAVQSVNDQLGEQARLMPIYE